MARRLAAPQIVVVHGGQVVVDQRVRVQELQREARYQRDIIRFPDGLGRGEAEDGPDAFAPAEKAIAHGLVQAGWALRFGREIPTQSGVHTRAFFLPYSGRDQTLR